MKTVVKVFLLAAVVFVMCSATSDAQFRHRGNWLGPVLTLATDPIGFGVNFEHGITENIGIGGIIRYWGQTEESFYADVTASTIIPQAQVAYHFMPGDQLDPYAGGRLGYAIRSVSIDYKPPYDNYDVNVSDTGDLFLTAYGGLRYFFNSKIAVNGSLEFRIAGTDYFDSSLQLSIGADFTL